MQAPRRRCNPAPPHLQELWGQRTLAEPSAADPTARDEFMRGDLLKSGEIDQAEIRVILAERSVDNKRRPYPQRQSFGMPSVLQDAIATLSKSSSVEPQLGGRLCVMAYSRAFLMVASRTRALENRGQAFQFLHLTPHDAFLYIK